jgi:hypothetical protein
LRTRHRTSRRGECTSTPTNPHTFRRAAYGHRNLHLVAGA